MQEPDCFGCGRFNRIGYAEQSCRSAVDGDEHHCLAFAPEVVCAGYERLNINPKFLEKASIPDCYMPTIDSSSHT